VIVLDRVTKTEGSRTVLRDVSALLPTGKSIGILGDAQSGKSTLLRLIAGLEKPSQGRVARRARVSWPLGETMRLEKKLSAEDNVRVLARIHGASPGRTLDAIAEFTQLGPRLGMPLGSFSGRERNLFLAGLWLSLDFDCYLIDDFGQSGSDFRRDYRKAFEARCRHGWILATSSSPGDLDGFCELGAILHRGALSMFDSFAAAAAFYDKLQGRRS
jgi:capsular polysaccharide transport system ATP-binding protein